MTTRFPDTTRAEAAEFVRLKKLADPILPRRAAFVAAEHLRETDNPAVGVGDSRLLHDIAEKLGMKHEGHRTEKRVLDRIERTNRGELIKTFISWPERGFGKCRRFKLPNA